jgi:hypothetical protein
MQRMSAWVFGLSAWIVQDGNYGEFGRGEVAEFAVEFEVDDLQTGEATARSATLVSDSDYAIAGEVVFTAGDVWVVDCGILIYSERRPAGVRVGHWVTGTAFLGVDPFPYFERLNRLPGMPALVYTWEITRIRRLTAPFVETRPRFFERDRSRWDYVDAEATDAWQDDEGWADYLLERVRRDVPPKHDSATAIP